MGIEKKYTKKFNNGIIKYYYRELFLKGEYVGKHIHVFKNSLAVPSVDIYEWFNSIYACVGTVQN